MGKYAQIATPEAAVTI